MSEHMSPIPSRIYNAAVGGHVCGPEDLDFGQKVIHLVKYDRDGNEVSFESQVTQANKIYVVHDDFVLSSNVTIPANCVLEFDGGSIANSTGNNYYIDGNNCTFNQNVSYKIFNNVIFKNFALEYIDIRWFGAKPAKTATDAIEDSAPYFQKAMDMCEYYQSIPIKVIGIYRISSTVICENHFQLFGNNYDTVALFNTGIEETPESMIVVGSGVTAFHIKGNNLGVATNMSYCSFNIHNLRFQGPTILGNDATLFKITTSGAPSRLSSIRQCVFQGFEKVIDFDYDETLTDGTMLCNLSINECSCDSCGSIIFTEDTDYMTIQNLHVYDNVIEVMKGNAIELCNPASSVIIENNLMEGNLGYNLYISKSSKNCNVEVTGNYFESQDKFVYINVTDKRLNFTATNNYFYPNSGKSKIVMKGVCIEKLDDFENYLSTSEFEICWFGKNVSVGNLPIECIKDYCWFEDIPSRNCRPFNTMALLPSQYKLHGEDIVCRKDVFGTNHILTDRLIVTPNTTAGDKALFIFKANLYGNIGALNTIYGKSHSIDAKNPTKKCGYCLAVVTFPEDSTVNYLQADCYVSTANTKVSFNSSVTIIELRKYQDIETIDDVCYGNNVVNTGKQIDTTQVVQAVNESNGLPTFWNGSGWVDATGTTI